MAATEAAHVAAAAHMTATTAARKRVSRQARCENRRRRQNDHGPT
jgi:hypothetical protein